MIIYYIDLCAYKYINILLSEGRMPANHIANHGSSPHESRLTDNSDDDSKVS